jgi:RimJ/RimL family protein N-acetyltransferase
MKYVLETDRLRLREFTLDDIPFIVELVNSEGWLKYIGDRNIKTHEQAKNYLENGPLKSYQVNGYGLCLVETKEDQKAIGMCGILKRDTLDSPDIGFAFLPNFSGKGYAFEMALATLNYAKENLRITSVAAITMIDNVRSIKLLTKLGFGQYKKFRFPDTTEELLLYVNQEI